MDLVEEKALLTIRQGVEGEADEEEDQTKERGQKEIRGSRILWV